VHPDLQHSEDLDKVGNCHFCQKEKGNLLGTDCLRKLGCNWFSLAPCKLCPEVPKMPNHNDAYHFYSRLDRY